MESHPIKELSIQISLNGLSFCILKRAEATIEYLRRFDFSTALTPENLLLQLQKIITAEAPLNQSFDKILVLFQNELSSLVPEEFFDDNHAADFLKFSSKILKTDYVSHDVIALNNSINVFVPYMNINNYLFELYGEFEYKHISSVFLEHILSTGEEHSGDVIYINVEQQHFEMAVIKAKQLQLFNTFEYFSEADFLYFILFTIEQLKLNAEIVKVKLTGNIIKNDPLYELLYTYIRFVEFDATPTYKHLERSGENSHRHALILNSFK